MQEYWQLLQKKIDLGIFWHYDSADARLSMFIVLPRVWCFEN